MAIGFHQQQEKRALQLSLMVAASFVVVSLGFALWTQSNAILFDGVYSCIAFFMALLTLKVASLVALPDDDRFHFGYTAIEPTLNLFKALIIVICCVYAVVGAAMNLLEGGNQSNYGVAIGYGVYASIGCFAMAAYMHRKSKQMHSELVKVDGHTWFVDGVLSASILLAFIIAYGLDTFGLGKFSPLIDPILLLILGIAMLPVPARIMLESLNEVINKAPPESVSLAIEKRLMKTLTNVPFKHVEVRISKQGRDKYLLVHIIVDDEFGRATISELDDIRRKCEKEMRQWDPTIIMDILFIQDPKFAD